jgi:hypothetical protein
MAGSDNLGNPTQGKLATLNLSQTNIVQYKYVNYADSLNSAYYKVWIDKGHYGYYDCFHTHDNIISSHMFRGCTALTTITLPSSAISIAIYAFQGCSSLTSIDLPNSITSIAGSAFADCIGLIDIYIPSSVTNLHENAFVRCTSLKAFNVSEQNLHYCDVDGVLFDKTKTILCRYPYAKATSYDIPEGVQCIGNSAFSGCSSLSQIAIPNGVDKIGDYAFKNCTGLVNITIPNGVDKIGNSAFYDCTGLTAIDLPNSITTIEALAFKGCTGLTAIDLPNNIITINIEVFKDCTGLAAIDLPNNITTIESYAFAGCTGLIAINLPNSLTTIESVAFVRCTGLVELTIPDSVIEIDPSSFGYCTGLTRVVLPNNSMFRMSNSSFEGCYNLSEIHSPNSTPPASARGCFGGGVNKETCLLYVPIGSKATYQSTPGWQDFINIIEENITTLPVIPTSDVVVRSVAHGLSIETKEKTPIAIYAVSGQKVHQAYVNGTTNIFLNKGVYIVKIKDENRKVIIK